MPKEKNQIVLLSDGKYLDQIRKIRLDIDKEIRDILEEYKELEAEVKKGGIRELGNANKAYLNMLLSIKKARVDAVSKQIQNAKDANEINLIIEGFKAQIEQIKEAMKDESRKTITRPKEAHPYSTTRK